MCHEMPEALMMFSSVVTAKAELELRKENEVICHYHRSLEEHLSLLYVCIMIQS